MTSYINVTQGRGHWLMFYHPISSFQRIYTFSYCTWKSGSAYYRPKSRIEGFPEGRKLRPNTEGEFVPYITHQGLYGR